MAKAAWLPILGRIKVMPIPVAHAPLIIEWAHHLFA
jgi:hypothetical protein